MATTVLIIDRKQELVGSMADALSGAGYDVSVAWRFEQVKARLSAAIPDVIVSHSTVPSEGMGEVELMATLDAVPTALVVISSRPFAAIPDLPARAIRVRKPFGREELIGAIKKAIDLRQR